MHDDSSPAETTGLEPSAEEARAWAEVRRVSALIRAGFADLPPEIEPAHHATWFAALADQTRRSNVDA